MRKNKLFNRTYNNTIIILIVLFFISLTFLLNRYQGNHYFFILFLPVFVLYSVQILLIKYKKRETKLIRNIGYLVYLVFIVQVALIMFFEPIARFYIQFERNLLPFFYKGILLNSVWPAGTLSLIFCHTIYRITRKPFLFIVPFIVLMSLYVCYMYFIQN